MLITNLFELIREKNQSSKFHLNQKILYSLKIIVKFLYKRIKLNIEKLILL
jgi:hypothetical protein